MKPGEKVTIYTDPCNYTMPEGQATLIREDTKKSGPTLKRWLVEFTDGYRNWRWIKPRQS